MMAYASWYYIICKMDKNNKYYFPGEMLWIWDFANSYNIIKCSLLQLLGEG